MRTPRSTGSCSGPVFRLVRMFLARATGESHALVSVDELGPEYDLASLTGGVRGKYFDRATTGTTLVLLERDVAEAFPDGSAVNRALRAYLPSERDGQPHKALPPTSRAKRPAQRATLARAARG